MTTELFDLLEHRAGHDDLPEHLGVEPEPPRLELIAKDFAQAAQSLDVDVATIRAVAEVEAAGRGFLTDGRPQILFEAHIFGRLTEHRYAHLRDSSGKPLSSRSWDRSLYGRTGDWQHQRLDAAAQAGIDTWGFAHQSASWGLFQIMGFNHVVCGYRTIEGFVEAMFAGAPFHLDAFVAFIKSRGLAPALKRRDWAAFARAYNGPAFSQNSYDTKLAAAYARSR